MEKVMSQTWQIGIFGMRVSVRAGKARPALLIEMPLTPAQHYSRAQDHMKAADELLRLGVEMHEQPTIG
jgi:hypothetical protein